MGVRGGEVHCPAGLANWGALKAIFKNISNNDCVPTDATHVSGVSSGCVVPAPHLTPAAHGSCLVSLISASGLHSPQSLRSDLVPPPTYSCLPRAPLAHRPTPELPALSAAACSPSAGGWGLERSAPSAWDTLPSALWTVAPQERHSGGPCSVLPVLLPCQAHARVLSVPAELQKPWPWRKLVGFPTLLPLCKRPVAAERVHIVQLKQPQETAQTSQQSGVEGLMAVRGLGAL